MCWGSDFHIRQWAKTLLLIVSCEISIYNMRSITDADAFAFVATKSYCWGGLCDHESECRGLWPRVMAFVGTAGWLVACGWMSLEEQ